MRKILVATQKPFAAVAKEKITDAAEYSGFCVEFLEHYAGEDDLCAAIVDADALIVRSDIVSAKVLDAAKRLKVVVRAGAGYDNLDLDALHERGILAMNTPGQNANGVAEMALSFLVMASRNFFAPGSGCEIEGKVLGLHGFGAVARLVARKAQAVGMKVIAYDPYVDASVFSDCSVERVETLADLYASSYAVSVHVPALPSTIKCISTELLSALNSSPDNCSFCTSRRILINTARAEVMDYDALKLALAENKALYYASDVMPSQDVADSLETEFSGRVWINRQKIGGQTGESNVRCAQSAATRIIDFFAGVPQKGL